MYCIVITMYCFRLFTRLKFKNFSEKREHWLRVSALNIVFSRMDPNLFIYPKLVRKAKNVFSINLFGIHCTQGQCRIQILR